MNHKMGEPKKIKKVIFKKIRVGEGVVEAFGRDTSYIQGEQDKKIFYLDRRTGNLLEIYLRLSDAFFAGEDCRPFTRYGKRIIKKWPKRFILLDGLDHSEHHEWLQAFIRSDWTEDSELSGEAYSAYSGSIGRWTDHAPDEAVSAFEKYRMRCIRKKFTHFLQPFGLKPIFARGS